MTKYDAIFTAIERPFAWLDYDALDHNIQFVKNSCGEKHIRIATKSVRSVAALKYIQQQLPNCSGFMTFTASETVFLLEQGLDHLLIGYPVHEEEAIKKLTTFVKQGKNITFMVDHVQQVELLHQIAASENVQISICIDINVSTDYKVLYFGTKRSPIHSMDALRQFTEAIKHYTGVVVTSCMAYDAQIAGVTDQTNDFFGLKSVVIRQLKKNSLQKFTAFRDQAIDYLQKMYNLQFINAGGSGSMQIMRETPSITEITVGSAFFAPGLFSQYASLQLQSAAGFALRVTRQFSDDVFVCHGGGYIASGAPGKDRLPVFLEPEHYAFSSLEGAGEVQTPIIVKNRQHKIGDSIYLRHAKAGELCERFRVLHTTRSGKYTGAIQTYRGEDQCFL